jgi:hypothetical protein
MNYRPELKNKILGKHRLLIRRLPLVITMGFLCATLWYLYLFVSRTEDGRAALNPSLHHSSDSLELVFQKVSDWNMVDTAMVPVLVSFAHQDLKLTELGGKVTNREGKDIFFESGEGTILSFEKERYEPFAGRISAWIHINRQIINSGKIIIRFGDLNAINPDQPVRFPEPYQAVWHMNGDFLSSASMPLAGEYRKIKDSEGIICGAKEFIASTGSSIIFDRPAEMTKAGSFQISAWIMTNGSSENQFVFTDRNNKGGFSLFIDETSRVNLELYSGKNKTNIRSGESVSAGTWTRITAGYDALNKEAYIYINEKPESLLKNVTSFSPGGRLVIGAHAARCHGFFNGLIDELRISSMVNNPSMVKFHFENENNPESLFRSVDPVLTDPEGLVRISHLETDVKRDYVSVRWESEREQKVESYFLERATGKGNYKLIQTCRPGQDLSGKQNYILLDSSPIEGDAYYRIGYTTINGMRIEGKPMAVHFSPSANTLSISHIAPNPFHDRFAVTFNTTGKESVSVSLTSISGEVVHQTAMIPEEAGEQVFRFQQSGKLAPGIYFLNLKQADNQRTLKLVKSI